ncbi:MAG: 2-dehydropantoate 2-reductase [Methyloceanibacter sp.]
MALKPNSRIVIAGAGSVGCYLGGCLAAAGRNVGLLLREPLAEAIALHGLRVSDLGGNDETVSPSSLKLAAYPSMAFRGAEIVLVTVKCRHTREMADLIEQYVPENAVVVSLQNGVNNVAVLREVLGSGHRVVAGIVPFNVVQTRNDEEAPRFHRASSGTIQIGKGVEGLRDLLDVPGAPVAEHSDIEALLWSKLLINLNNALNALSGLPLAEELSDRRWRLLLREQMREAFPVLQAAGIRTVPIEGVHPKLIAFALRLRDPIFRLVAGRILAVDPSARSSMWEDLEARRQTEIDYIQGEIVKLAEQHRLRVPLNEAVVYRIKDAEKAARGSPGLSPVSLKAGP